VYFCCGLVIVAAALVSLSVIFFIAGLVSVLLLAYPVLIFISGRFLCVLVSIFGRISELVLGRVSDLQMGKPFWYVTSHPWQLSLAIPIWVGAMSTSKSWDIYTDTPCNALVPYPCLAVETGVWLRAKERR